MASHAQDDGFHEIQLNGKQLVFVFMATTVVLVVTFLCGVLVGRGVRGEQTETARVEEVLSADDQLRGAADPAKPPTVQQNEDPTRALPPAPAEGGASALDGPGGTAAGTAVASGVASAGGPLSAPPPTTDSRESAKPASNADASQREPVKAAAVKPDPAKLAVAKNEAAKNEPAKNEPAKADVKEPVKTAATAARESGRSAAASLPAATDSKSGWVVQVAAVKTRGEADTIAKRLTSKGYSAFVLSNTANVYRVRVGGYPSKRDADTVAAKLRREERVTPWVTR